MPSLNDPKASTLHQHYYPEGGWGWLVLAAALLTDLLASTGNLSAGFLITEIRTYFKLSQESIQPVAIASSSMAVSLLLSPLMVALSKRQSVRLLAMFGGLITSLSSLFTSFVSQLHQLYLSYGLLGGAGEGLVRDTAAAIYGQYFKRKRNQVEIIFLVGYGFGIATLPLFFSYCLRTVGWRRSFQIVAGIQTAACFIISLYRPASLYHPQRRAILHIKSLQKRSKTKDKMTNLKEKRQYLDFSVLKSKTVQILICGTSIVSFGITAPFTLIVEEMSSAGLDLQSICYLQVNLGVAVSVGALVFGLLATQNNTQCLIAKQYLCQAAALLLSGWFLAYPALNGFHGYVLFVWIYGIGYGGYIYSLRTCVFEKVRARNYARTWSFMMWSQALPSIAGKSLIYYLNGMWGSKRGYYLCSATVFLGSMSLFFIDIHKSKMQKKKQQKIEQNDALFQISSNGKPMVNMVILTDKFCDVRKSQELTCISEEILVDPCIEDYIDNCITSCNKEEKFLMPSEFENNLFQTEEKEKTCCKEFINSESQHLCSVCFHAEDTERHYSSQKAQTVSNIDVMDEITSF